MKFLKKTYKYIFPVFFAVLFLIIPVANVGAAEFGCVVDGVCTKIEQPDEATARTACETYCRTLNATPFVSDKTCVFTPTKCVQVTGEAASSGCTPGNNGREVCTLTNPIGSTEVSSIVAKVISTLLGIIGGLTLLMFVWGGFQWLTSAGSPEKVKNGMQTMVWAVIGVMLVLASYLLLSTFLNFLTGKA